MSDIVERLRNWADCNGYDTDEAADEIVRLRAERDRLRDALKNLIEAADHVGSSIYDWERLLPRYIEEGFAALKGDTP